MSATVTRLRELLGGDRMVLAPFVYDALQAKVAQQSESDNLAKKYKIYYRTKDGEDLGQISEKFGVSEEQPMQSVAKYRMEIQKAAKNLIENELFEEDGSVLIRTLDLK